MTGQTVLIAALSGRALAQSARRAGYVPLVVDAFADLDMQAAAQHFRVLPAAVQRGFTVRSLVPKLDELVAEAASQPIGLVLGSGFEDKPQLMRHLDQRFELIGTPAEVVRELKDPILLSQRLTKLAIRHPETTCQRPADNSGWLIKTRGATGGSHVQILAHDTRASAKRYYQRRIDGRLISVFAIAAPTMTVMAVTSQWSQPAPSAPFRYGGAARHRILDGDVEMYTSSRTLIRECGLRGLVSFDFCVDDSGAHLLEVNPRPGATLDLFDRGDSALFAAHVDASRHGVFRNTSFGQGLAASAILYADAAPFIMPRLEWPDWAQDRTPPGTPVAAHAPIASVLAVAHNGNAAKGLVAKRLAILEGLIYGHKKHNRSKLEDEPC